METDRIMKAQSARGADFVTGSIIQRAKIWYLYWFLYSSSAFRRADELAIAMEARLLSRWYKPYAYEGTTSYLCRLYRRRSCHFGYHRTHRFMVARSMRNIRIIVAYDGTDLAGYQKQPDDKGLNRTRLLRIWISSKICNEPIQIYGASRTDAGVHAKFQVCTFQTSGSIPAENIPRAMIAHIPKDIVVLEAPGIPLDWSLLDGIYMVRNMYIPFIISSLPIL